MVRAICFDLFDTLVDLSFADLPRMTLGGREVPTTAGLLYELASGHVDVSCETFAHELHAVDRLQRETRYREGREISTHERFDALLERLGRPSPALGRVLADRHMELVRDQVRVPDHHRALLGALAERWPLYVCSNFTDTESAERVLREAGFAEFFAGVVVSESVGWRKPRPEIFEEVLARAGLPATSILHVGDNLEADVSGAKALGMPAAWLTRRVSDPDRARSRHRGPPPDFELGDLGELESVVAREGAD